MRRTKWEASLDKRQAIRDAEATGQVADSMDVRADIVRRIHSGEITLEQGQSELAAIKRRAKRDGKLTRSQVWSRS